MGSWEKISKAEEILREVNAELVPKLSETHDRERGTIIHQMHRAAGMLDHSPQFFSQAGQDRVVDQLLDGKTGGVFVDVGGFDGVAGSNTLFFEIFRGWTGLLIEASPVQLAKARAIRRCPALGYAVAADSGPGKFLEVTAGYSQNSGFLETFDPRTLNTVRAHPEHAEVIHELERRTLASILEESGLDQVDYLSLDIEGGEKEILESFPFDKFSIEIIGVENNSKTDEIQNVMRARGYALVEVAGVDEFFRRT